MRSFRLTTITPQTGENLTTLRIVGSECVNTPGANRQFNRASPTPLPLKSDTLSAGPTPSV